MLEFRQVSRSFSGPEGEVQAIRDITFSVGPGELIAIHGPSGCGKTTLLLTAGALLRPTRGEVLVDGVDPYSLQPEQRSALRCENIGFVFQQFHLVPYLTVLENVLAPSAVRPQPGAYDRARELVHRFNLDHRVNHVPAQLSTGERQRTALARAMLNRAKLILADEPTGNLDNENSAMVLEYLTEASGEGAAVVVVTHDPHAAQRAQRTIHLKEGRMCEN